MQTFWKREGDGVSGRRELGVDWSGHHRDARRCVELGKTWDTGSCWTRLLLHLPRLLLDSLGLGSWFVVDDWVTVIDGVGGH